MQQGISYGNISSYKGKYLANMLYKCISGISLDELVLLEYFSREKKRLKNGTFLTKFSVIKWFNGHHSSVWHGK